MKSVKAKWTNPSMLQWARERLGFSPEQVQTESEKLEGSFSPIDAKLLKQWEQGDTDPELIDLETLSEIYVCPVGYFFLPKPPEESLALSYRGLTKDKEDQLSPLTQQTLERFLQLANWTVFAIEESGASWQSRISPRGSIIDKPIDLLIRRERERLGFTSRIRSDWKHRDDAFDWWRRKIEGLGVFCFQMKLEPGDVRGASVWIDSKYPFILINQNEIEGASGRLFTLLHEYGHLITESGSLVCDFHESKRDQNIESFANRFAARMLVSYSELNDRLKELGEYSFRQKWSDYLLREIREPFFVSLDVISIALQDIGLAPSDFYQSKRRIWNQLKPFGRGRIPRNRTQRERKFREIGYSLTQFISQKRDEAKLPILDLADMLGMKVEKTEEFLLWAKQKL